MYKIESFKHYLLLMEEYKNACDNKLYWKYNLKNDSEYLRLLSYYDSMKRMSTEYIRFFLPLVNKCSFTQPLILDFFRVLLGCYETSLGA